MALSIADSRVFSIIILSNPFFLSSVLNLSVASPISSTVVMCDFTELQNSVRSVNLSLPPAISTTFLLLNESIATIEASGFVAFESL